MKKFLSLLLAVIIMLQLCGCKKDDTSKDEPSSSSSQTSSQATSSTQPENVLMTYDDLTFKDMPDIKTELANVYTAGDSVAIMEFITPDLNTYTSTVVTYSLSKDKCLGTLDLGDGRRNIEPMSNGGFYITDFINRELSEYDSSCNKIKSIEFDSIKNIGSYISFAKLNSDESKMLIGDAASGKLILLDIKTDTSTPIECDNKIYQCMGIKDDKFITLDSDNNLCTVSYDGNVEVMYINNTAQYINNNYAIDLKGSYLTFLPLIKSQPIMVKIDVDSELICSALKSTVLTQTQESEYNNTLYFYNTNAMNIYSLPVDVNIVAAALTYDGYAIAIVKEPGNDSFTYKIYNPEQGTSAPLKTQDYNKDTINEIPILPDFDGSPKAKEIFKNIQDKYGIRIMFEDPDFFSIEDLGYVIEKTDEENVLKRIDLITEFLDFLPEGTFKEAGEERPLILFLCDDISKGKYGGVNTSLCSYNISYVTTPESDFLFKSFLSHELAHALERKTPSNILEGWKELMPEEIQKTYGDESLDVQFTPADEGNTTAWFIEPYGRNNEYEDRATVFEHIYADYLNGTNAFTSDELKKKAEYWKTILSSTYKACENTELLKW